MKKPNRIFVIGDIHGGWRALANLLHQIGYNPKKDQLIFLGDYVDGWSEGIEVIDAIIKLQQMSKFPPICLLGNHDAWLLEWLVYGIASKDWIRCGGKVTKKAYKKLKRKSTTEYATTVDAHIKFLRGCHYYYIDDDNNGFVHAGFKQHPKKRGVKDLHVYLWNRDMWKKLLMEDKPSICRQFKHIYIGHTTLLNYPDFKTNRELIKPVTLENVTNVDTGAGFDGKLTALNILTGEIFQSPRLIDLYPHEEGRGKYR